MIISTKFIRFSDDEDTEDEDDMDQSPPTRGKKLGIESICFFSSILSKSISLENGARGKAYGGMTDDLSDENDDQMGGGPDMDDDEDDVEMAVDPRSGRVDARPGGNARGQRQQPPPAYDDNEDF